MNKPISKTKLKNFRNRIEEILDKELELRKEVKLLYDKFMLDVGDDKMAERHVRQAFFQVQKKRITALLADRMEFHPFFTVIPSPPIIEEESEDDGII